LNYHHLLYFWLVAREGGVSQAAKKLHVSHPTVSVQVKALEDTLGERLFVRRGRKLELTEAGKLALGYADSIFGLGRELVEVLHRGRTEKRRSVAIGISDAMPKLVARRLLEPIFHLESPVQVSVREDDPRRLLAALEAHELDCILCDVSPPNLGQSRAFAHPLGSSGTTFFASPPLRARHPGPFPACLEGAPILVPTRDAALRAQIDGWLAHQSLSPRVVAECQDSALIQALGHDGVGFFTGPTVFESEIRRQSAAEVVGRVPQMRELYYAVTLERRFANPAISAIADAGAKLLEPVKQPRGRPRKDGLPAGSARMT
jgi:LysR family transcriptional activator of nhaA